MSFKKSILPLLFMVSAVGCFDIPADATCTEETCDESPVGEEGTACAEDMPCQDGLLCVGGKCLRACADNDVCGANQACIGNVCITAECLLPSDCKTPGPCEAAESPSCLDGQCVYAPRICEDAPPDECNATDDTFITYLQTGICNEVSDTCEYSSQEQECPSCDENCLSPCEQVVCVALNGGCSVGRCDVPVPGEPPACVYQSVDDGLQCTRQSGDPGTCTEGLCLECTQDDECNDSNACTSDTCNLETNRCEYSEPRECPQDSSGQCSADVCVPATGNCEAVPLSEGASCDDGSVCTLLDGCNGLGECVGTNPIDCNGEAQCEVAGSGRCDATDGSCSYEPSASGLSCNDGNPQTGPDTCDGQGRCNGTTNCTAGEPAGQCQELTGVFNTQTNTCQVGPSPAGRSCNDGNNATGPDTCNGQGQCTAATTCSAGQSAGQCLELSGTFNTSTNSCDVRSSPAGRSCNDGNNSTGPDTCNGQGQCTAANSCSAGQQVGQCQEYNGVYNTSTNQCEVRSRSGSCDDGQYCTVSDSCSNSSCRGSPRQCNSPPNECWGSGSCSESQNRCNYSPRTGASCSGAGGGDACVAGSCNSGGSCVGTRVAIPGLYVSHLGGAQHRMGWTGCGNARGYQVKFQNQRVNGDWADNYESPFYITVTSTFRDQYITCTGGRPWRFQVRYVGPSGAEGPWSIHQFNYSGCM